MHDGSFLRMNFKVTHISGRGPGYVSQYRKFTTYNRQNIQGELQVYQQ